MIGDNLGIDEKCFEDCKAAAREYRNKRPSEDNPETGEEKGKESSIYVIDKDVPSIIINIQYYNRNFI